MALYGPIDQVISASQRTQGNKGRKGISLSIYLILAFLKNKESAALEAIIFFIFLSHKSATTCQIGNDKVSNSKLKLILSNCIKNETIERTASSQQ